MAETNVTASNEQFRYYPYSGTFHVQRSSFWAAGQDSYTLPPAQNPDLFQSLQNVEPVTQGDLRRRRGSTIFSSFGTPLNLTQHGYGFRSDSLNLRELVFTTPIGGTATDEFGNTVTGVATSHNGVAPRMVLSRDYGYFATGNANDLLKWDGTTSPTTNWGIKVTTSMFGPNAPTAASNISIGGTATWSNPTNIEVLDGNFASASVSSATGGTSKILYASTFGLAPGATAVVQGIQVDIWMNANGGTANTPASVSVGLTLDGTHTTGYKSVAGPQIPTAGATKVSFGGQKDLWGNSSLLGSQISPASFGTFIIAGFGGMTAKQFNIDFVQITIFLVPPAITVTVGSAGNITLVSGRTYFYVFGNSKTGHFSALSQASLSTGPISTASKVNLTNIPVSTDPQVDIVQILATADGNDQTTLFGLVTLSNGTTSYTDNTPDALSASVTSGPSLLTQLLYQDTDANGNLHGVANNDPPPQNGQLPIKHKGRLYMAQGHNLFFSKNLDDVTTATGTITGKWEEAWPATYTIDVSERDETVQGLLSDGETLWIGTERAVRRLIGDSPSNFQKPEIQFNETGVVNQDVWQIVFAEGQPVGTMWLTPDLRVMSSDFNTYVDVGRPIQDLLNSINQSVIQTSHACFVSGGAFDLYMLYIPTASNTLPDTICVYNLRTKTWVIWNMPNAPAFTTKHFPFSLFNISASGAPQWFFGDANGDILYWDPTVTTDSTGLLNLPIQVSATTSWLDFGDNTLRKMVNQLILYSQNSSFINVSISGADTSVSMQSGGNVVQPTTLLKLGPLGDSFVPLAGTKSHYRWYQLVFSVATGAQGFLEGFNLETVPLHRW